MMVLQGVLLVLVAGGGTAVVLTRDPLRQALVAGVFGLLLGVLFFAFQAPDVALSQIVIGGLALPAMLVLTLSKLAQLRRLDE
jgi:energy-converting hydrogenase B subunit D